VSSIDAVVTGAGGFIGGHLVAALLADGKSVRGVDVKPFAEWHQVHADAENVQGDVSLLDTARSAVGDAAVVYNLAADMGGMGFIENNKAACMLSVLTSTHVLLAAKEAGVERYFYSSSACVYAAEHQTSPDVVALREEDAYPAMPEDGYGWEKLFSERMCRHFLEDYGMQTRVARYHNVYGPEGARLPPPPSPASTPSTSGATACRPARSCTSTTACGVPARSPEATTRIRSTWAATSLSRSTRWSTSSRRSPE
jgi:nucleoside-diphosphate-sugar epimerase